MVSWTGTDPAGSAGVMNVNEVAETTVGAAVVRPIVTDIPAANPRPVTGDPLPTGPWTRRGVTELFLAVNAGAKGG